MFIVVTLIHFHPPHPSRLNENLHRIEATQTQMIIRASSLRREDKRFSFSCIQFIDSSSFVHSVGKFEKETMWLKTDVTVDQSFRSSFFRDRCHIDIRSIDDHLRPSHLSIVVLLGRVASDEYRSTSRCSERDSIGSNGHDRLIDPKTSANENWTPVESMRTREKLFVLGQ